ncbi:2-hydroxychromene-2-carboxylate isomerase [Striga asiatica]|uniref:2-hydroxychromene-2-carboxylate isomerase n=1 Tax=Striga asiatica TaxID=4170 RepID=A0A5A7QVQ5_STRAF|nr:2-hydroxychromene-2-carboxylate isomerase [Striga asiatica]
MSLSLSSLAFSLYKLTQSDPTRTQISLVKPIKNPVRASSSAAPGIDFTTLESAIAEKDSDGVKVALDELREGGWAKKWSSQPYISRRTTSLRELTSLGIKNAENLAIPSTRNDAAFLFTVVGTTGFLGVLAGQLPGDWGFFVPYLIGSISLVVLAVGSISPGSKPQLSKDQQQNLTRWAVLFAASLIKNNRALHEALMSAMSKKASVVECIEAIEKAE